MGTLGDSVAARGGAIATMWVGGGGGNNRADGAVGQVMGWHDR